MLDHGDDRACRFPQLAGATAWRYGCRCERCTAAHQGSGPGPFCEIEGCTNLRLKYTRRCVDHPGGRQRANKKVRCEPCELCGRTHTWYESTVTQTREDLRDLYRRTCNGCRQRYMGVIKTHRMDTQDALRLIMATHCELCAAPFSITEHGRRSCHVDHDHRCCPGSESCGRCIRGILCPRCNRDVGLIEQIEEAGIRRVIEYIGRWHKPLLEAVF